MSHTIIGIAPQLLPPLPGHRVKRLQDLAFRMQRFTNEEPKVWAAYAELLIAKGAARA